MINLHHCAAIKRVTRHEMMSRCLNSLTTLAHDLPKNRNTQALSVRPRSIIHLLFLSSPLVWTAFSICTQHVTTAHGRIQGRCRWTRILDDIWSDWCFKVFFSGHIRHFLYLLFLDYSSALSFLWSGIFWCETCVKW